MKFLDLQVTESTADEPHHVGWFGDSWDHWPLLPGDPLGELERGDEPARLDASHAANPEEFAGWSGSEPSETSTGWFEECYRHSDRIAAPISSTDQDGEKFWGGQCAGAESPEALARAIIDWRRGGAIVIGTRQ
jgi:hypothetical protein